MTSEPRSARDLVMLLDSSPDLKQKIYNLVTNTDASFLQELHSILGSHMAQKQITLEFMDGPDVERAFVEFFKKNRMSGEYLKLF